MSDEDAAENQWIADHDKRRWIAGLEQFLNWWDANPNDHDWFKHTYPELWRRFLAIPLTGSNRPAADGLSDQARAAVTAIADRIEQCLGNEYVDTVYLAEDTLYRLDTLAGNEPVRGQRVDFP